MCLTSACFTVRRSSEDSSIQYVTTEQSEDVKFIASAQPAASAGLETTRGHAVHEATNSASAEGCLPTGTHEVPSSYGRPGNSDVPDACDATAAQAGSGGGSPKTEGAPSGEQWEHADGKDAAVGVEPMLSAVIDSRVSEFSDDVLAYNGRPPMMDIFAGAAGDALTQWDTLRVAVVPSSAQLLPGEYACGPGQPSFIMLIGERGVFDSTSVDAWCTIIVESAGTQPGEVFSGRFEATVHTTDGADSVLLEQGRFFGVVP